MCPLQVRTLDPDEADIFFWLDSAYGWVSPRCARLRRLPAPSHPLYPLLPAPHNPHQPPRQPHPTHNAPQPNTAHRITPRSCAGNVGFIAEYLLKQLDFLRLHNPFWDRGGGKDHAYYLVQDRGGMDVVPAALSPAIQICQFGAPARLPPAALLWPANPRRRSPPADPPRPDPQSPSARTRPRNAELGGSRGERAHLHRFAGRRRAARVQHAQERLGHLRHGAQRVVPDAPGAAGARPPAPLRPARAPRVRPMAQHPTAAHASRFPPAPQDRKWLLSFVGSVRWHEFEYSNGVRAPSSLPPSLPPAASPAQTRRPHPPILIPLNTTPPPPPAAPPPPLGQTRQRLYVGYHDRPGYHVEEFFEGDAMRGYYRALASSVFCFATFGNGHAVPRTLHPHPCIPFL